ncbi:MAG: hypothetical protein JEZ14_25540, partial [Marinilabiliaceae bacterium]|nr:hypothetical protein [Marinilabiliaceae bacterium]
MKKIASLLLWIFIVLSFPTIGQTFIESDTFGNCETFENGLPASWQATDGGSLEISNKRYKQGTHALMWNWSNNSKITVTDPQLGQASINKNSGLKQWLYNETAIDDSIRFVFYDASNRVRCAFYYKLNFTGWRGLWVRFWDDIAVSGKQKLLTRMEVCAPQTVTSGQVYFDIVEFASSVSYKRSPSYQYVHPYPYNADEEVKDEWAGWIYKNRYPQATLPLPSEVSSDQQEVLSTITTRFEEWLLGTETYAANAHYQARLQARDAYISYGVQLFNQLDVAKDENGIITGPPLFTNKSSHRPNFGRDIGEKLCLQLALDYRVNNNASSKEKLLLLFDYMHDQGWAEGSAMETLDHQKLRTAAWVYSVYLLKDDLKLIPWKNGQSLLDREMATLHWLSYFNILFAPLKDTLEVSVDDFRSNTIFRLIYILMMDNTDPAKVQYMNHYTQWLNRNLRTFEGWTGGLKPDGMGYHHRGPYMNAYSNNGVHCMTQVLYFLRHTPYDANAEAKENIKKYLLNYRLISQYYDVPKGVSGRISGLDKATSMISPMAYMA